MKGPGLILVLSSEKDTAGRTLVWRVRSSEKGRDRTLVWQVRRKDRAEPWLNRVRQDQSSKNSGSEFGERNGLNLGPEFVFRVWRRYWAKPWFGSFGDGRKEQAKP